MRDSIGRLLWDEAGQDLIEYALLTAGIGLAGIAVWPAITASIGVTYEALDANSQDIWETPPPIEGS